VAASYAALCRDIMRWGYATAKEPSSVRDTGPLF